jgi:hypothetical protein
MQNVSRKFCHHFTVYKITSSLELLSSDVRGERDFFYVIEIAPTGDSSSVAKMTRKQHNKVRRR